jgi:tetratricopeptide (TPR) repeat protein
VAKGLASLVLAAVLAPAPSLAQQGADSAVATARATFEHAEALVAQGRFDEARAVLAAAPRGDDYARTYGAFVDGRLAEATGRLTVARDAYRAILARHPGLARVRLHLARVLTALEDVEAARHHFDFVLGAPDLAAPLADRVRADLRALDNVKRWSAQAYVTVAPTTNMTSGTSQERVSIGGLDFKPAESGRARSGVGVLYGADVAYAAPFADDWGWLATLSTAHRDHSGRAFDDRSVRASAGLRYTLPAGVVTAEMTGQRRWFGGRDYMLGFGPQITARGFVGVANRLTASVSAVAQRFDELGHQDGRRISASASWDRFTWPGQFLRVGALFERETTRSVHTTFSEYGGLAGYNIDLPWALTAYPELSYAWRTYDGDFPLMGRPRRDRRFVAAVTLLKKDLSLWGFAPRVQVSYTDNRSNVKLYEYDRLDASLTLTRAF